MRRKAAGIRLQVHALNGTKMKLINAKVSAGHGPHTRIREVGDPPEAWVTQL